MSRINENGNHSVNSFPPSPPPKQAIVNSGLPGGEAFVNLLNCGDFHILAS